MPVLTLLSRLHHDSQAFFRQAAVAAIKSAQALNNRSLAITHQPVELPTSAFERRVRPSEASCRPKVRNFRLKYDACRICTYSLARLSDFCNVYTDQFMPVRESSRSL